MNAASAILLDGYVLRTDCTEEDLVRYPNRFRDADGAATWEKLFAIVNKLEDSDPTFSFRGFQQHDLRRS